MFLLFGRFFENHNNGFVRLYSTIIEIDWTEFDRKQYLKDISIPIQHNKTDAKHGTKIEIYSKIDLQNNEKDSKKELKNWTTKQEEALLRELRNLSTLFSSSVD